MADTITLAIDALTSAAFIEGGVSIERTEEARERTERRKRELIEAIAAGHPQAVEAQAPAAVAVPNEDTQDLVSKALRKAWQLGQTYWQQADSDYISQQKKSDATQAKFQDLIDETRAALAATPAAKAEVQAEPVAWMYSFTHSSAIGHGDHNIGPVVTKDRKAAFGVGCFDQQPLFTSPQAQPADALDAERWRALLACGRIRLFGTAGVNGSGIHDPSQLTPYNEPYGNYVHFGAEFWSTFPDQDHYNTKENPVYARATLTEFADASRAAMAAKGER